MNEANSAPPNIPPAFVDALLRTRLSSFIRKSFGSVAPGVDYHHNWHIDAITWRLQEVLEGRITRLIIAMPPRSLKSIAASVAFPAFALGHDPSRRIITASYSADLAIKHANDCRALMRSTWYRRLFPQTVIDPGKDSESEFATTRRGHRLSTSVGGTLTGRGGDLIVIDDPLKAADAHSEPKREAVNAWFSNTLLSRLDDKRKGAIVIVMQRVHQNDLVGHLLEQSLKEWNVLSLPAIAEEEHVVEIDAHRKIRRPIGHLLHEAREPLSVLASLKASLGSDLFAAQYQQSPVPPGGALIRRAWVRRAPIPLSKAPGEKLIHSWDTATKAGENNDWSVCTIWRVGPEGYRLIEVIRERLEYQDLKRRARTLALRDAPDAILIEDMGVGSALIADLRVENFAAIAIRPEADKVTRLAVKAPLFESGRVIFPERASWLPDLEAELFAFPQSKHDDQVDSISQALAWMSRPIAEPRIRRL
ncbi:phage terminase large subunit [Methylosinus sp. KRF6]|uniref:phage terminase large subunit n=1 Tax=Methylosinus sp. KRF6 TaxID=2846853 RepID=UPI001C0B74AE|nr:phage terminase large subunit [Methylosinus sp. KRF6]MBU3888572.1 phage terminase large subunit [Methylosinus sp. KRF6]